MKPPPTLKSSLAILSQISRTPTAPLQALLRTTGYKLRPPHAVTYAPARRQRQDALLAAGCAGLHQRAEILVEPRPGSLPTIIVGGFVPDATAAFYLLRGGLLRHGSVYYFHYPRCGFSTELFSAQLEDLIEEVATDAGRRPLLVAVSFGAGVVIECLRRAALRGTPPPLAGLLLVSPVTCQADLLDPAAPRPTTLLGRVLLPYLKPGASPDQAVVDRSRAIFLKMFEAGAQNQAALTFLLTQTETQQLRSAVIDAINAVNAVGAFERVQALRALPEPTKPQVLYSGPTLILYAEKEGAVLQEHSPSWREYTTRPEAWFPQGRCVTVANHPDHPVQHASLIFHSRNFAPHFAALIQAIRRSQRRAA